MIFAWVLSAALARAATATNIDVRPVARPPREAREATAGRPSPRGAARARSAEGAPFFAASRRRAHRGSAQALTFAAPFDEVNSQGDRVVGKYWRV